MAYPPVTSEGKTESTNSIQRDSESTTNCLVRIRRTLSSLDGARRQVADYVLADPWASHGLSIGELAERAGVSENAVSRFTRSVGYAGYRAFSQALSVDLGRTLGVTHDQPVELVKETEDGSTRPADLVARVFDLEIACLRDTLANLNEVLIEQAITAIAEAPRILLIGTGSAAPLCHMAQYRLSNLRLEATWTSDTMGMVSEVSRLRPEDVVVGVSHSGRTRATVEVLEYAQSVMQATTICLTAVRNSQITQVSDIPLVVFGPKVSVGTGQFSARVSGMVLLEAITTAVGVKKYGGAAPRLEELSAMQDRINNLGPGRKSRRRGGA